MVTCGCSALGRGRLAPYNGLDNWAATGSATECGITGSSLLICYALRRWEVEMNKIEKSAKEAETLGFSKYVSDSGVCMVISTQDELDAVIRQAVESDRATRAEGSLCA
jgi:hypothetical protein